MVVADTSPAHPNARTWPAPGPRSTFACAAAGLSLLLGVMVLVGWAIDAPKLRSVISGAVEMKANTALGLIAVSCALFILLAGARSSGQRLANALSIAVALLGLATLAEYAFEIQLGIDEWLVRDTGAAFNQAKGRMSPYSALVFVLLGMAGIALTRTGLMATSVVRVAGGLAAAIGIVSFVGYLWNAAEIVTDQIAPPVAINTASAFMLLGAAIFLLARPAHAGSHGGSRLEVLVLSGFVPTALFVIVGGGLTYESGANFAQSSSRIAHTQGVRAEIGQAYAAVADAELALRDLVLGGEPAGDSAVAMRAAAARERVTAIGKLVSDNPAQSRLQRELASAVELRMRALEGMARVYREQGEAKAEEALTADARSGGLAGLHALSEKMDEAEAGLLRSRTSHAERQRRITLAILLFTLAALTGLFLFLFRRIQREIRVRGDTQEELKRLNQELEQRVVDRTLALSFQQDFLRRVIDLQQDLVYAKDRDGRFVLANLALAEAWNTTVEELTSRREAEVAPDTSEAERFRGSDLLVIDERREVVIPEETLTTASGEVRWLSTVKRPILSADGTQIVLGVSTDITERKAAEAAVRQLAAELEQRVAERTADLHESNLKLQQAQLDSEAASRAKSAFLANMSHEIRTPMNAIIGLTHLMALEAADAAQRQRLGKVGQAAQHLLQVINDILDMSKIEAGKLTLHEGEFVFDELLAGAAAMVADDAAEKGLDLVVDGRGLPMAMVGDAIRLSQVLINLLSNAVKFTERESVRLSGTVAAEQGLRVLVRFDVRDTGPGISPERQAALFTAFEQADNSMTRAHGGTGLGLALSRQLAMAMGGEAGMTSRLGEGSTFWFSAWLTRPSASRTSVAQGARAKLVPQSQDALRREHAGQRVLLVEDNEINLEVGQELLGAAGLRVDAARNGRQAVEMALANEYDLILMDMQMPVMDGLDATRAIRAAVATRLPIIAMTANAFVEDREACLAAGMDDHIAKPVDPSVLYATLLRWLRARTRPTGGDGTRASAHHESPKVPARASTLSERLGELSGIDIDIALKSVAGQMPLLAKVLKRVVLTYSAGAPELIDHTGSDAEQLRRWSGACHSMRGALASIGATRIAAELAVMESALADAAGSGNAVSLAELRDAGRRIHDDLTALVRAIADTLRD